MVELVIGDGSIDIPVLRSSGRIEVVGHKQDLQRTAATNQPRKPGHCTTAWDDTGTDLELTEHRILTRGEAQIAGEDELAAGATSASPDRGDADRWGPRQANGEIEPCRHPRGSGRQRGGLQQIVLHVVVCEKEVRIRAVEGD